LGTTAAAPWAEPVATRSIGPARTPKAADNTHFPSSVPVAASTTAASPDFSSAFPSSTTADISASVLGPELLAQEQTEKVGARRHFRSEADAAAHSHLLSEMGLSGLKGLASIASVAPVLPKLGKSGQGAKGGNHTKRAKPSGANIRSNSKVQTTAHCSLSRLRLSPSTEEDIHDGSFASTRKQGGERGNHRKEGVVRCSLYLLSMNRLSTPLSTSICAIAPKGQQSQTSKLFPTRNS